MLNDSQSIAAGIFASADGYLPRQPDAAALPAATDIASTFAVRSGIRSAIVDSALGVTPTPEQDR
jgi:hypothetical protein